MNNLNFLKPGKRENAFSVQAAVVDRDKVGVQSANSQKYCVSIWDSAQKRYVNKIVEKNEFDML